MGDSAKGHSSYNALRDLSHDLFHDLLADGMHPTGDLSFCEEYSLENHGQSDQGKVIKHFFENRIMVLFSSLYFFTLDSASNIKQFALPIFLNVDKNAQVGPIFKGLVKFCFSFNKSFFSI